MHALTLIRPAIAACCLLLAAQAARAQPTPQAPKPGDGQHVRDVLQRIRQDVLFYEYQVNRYRNKLDPDPAIIDRNIAMTGSAIGKFACDVHQFEFDIKKVSVELTAFDEGSGSGSLGLKIPYLAASIAPGGTISLTRSASTEISFERFYDGQVPTTNPLTQELLDHKTVATPIADALLGLRYALITSSAVGPCLNMRDGRTPGYGTNEIKSEFVVEWNQDVNLGFNLFIVSAGGSHAKDEKKTNVITVTFQPALPAKLAASGPTPQPLNLAGR